MEILGCGFVWMVSSSRQHLLNYSAFLSDQSLGYEKKFLVFVFILKQFVALLHKKEMLLLHPPEREGRLQSIQTLSFMEMTSQLQGWSPFWDDCQVLNNCTYFTKSHSGMRWPSWGRKQKPHNPQGKTLIADVRMERKMNFLSLPSRAFLEHLFFEISSEDSHFNAFQLRHFKAWGNNHLETKIKS